MVQEFNECSNISSIRRAVEFNEEGTIKLTYSTVRLPILLSARDLKNPDNINVEYMVNGLKELTIYNIDSYDRIYSNIDNIIADLCSRGSTKVEQLVLHNSVDVQKFISTVVSNMNFILTKCLVDHPVAHSFYNAKDILLKLYDSLTSLRDEYMKNILNAGTAVQEKSTFLDNVDRMKSVILSYRSFSGLLKYLNLTKSIYSISALTALSANREDNSLCIDSPDDTEDIKAEDSSSDISISIMDSGKKIDLWDSLYNVDLKSQTVLNDIGSQNNDDLNNYKNVEGAQIVSIQKITIFRRFFNVISSVYCRALNCFYRLIGLRLDLY